MDATRIRVPGQIRRTLTVLGRCGPRPLVERRVRLAVRRLERDEGLRQAASKDLRNRLWRLRRLRTSRGERVGVSGTYRPPLRRRDERYRSRTRRIVRRGGQARVQQWSYLRLDARIIRRYFPIQSVCDSSNRVETAGRCSADVWRAVPRSAFRRQQRDL